MIDKELELPPTIDSFEPIVASDCKKVQIAKYYNEDILLVNSKYFNNFVS